MAPRIHDHQKTPPSHRVLTQVRGYFYPGEAARILGLDGIDYHQLRKLLLIASGIALTPGQSRKWARFTFRDLVTVRTSVMLAGGVGALRRGRHLRLKRVREACDALRRRFNTPDRRPKCPPGHAVPTQQVGTTEARPLESRASPSDHS